MSNTSQQVSFPASRSLPAEKGRWIFGFVVLLSAGLLFQVQFITAKYILPWFGGTPGVWTTCLLFFQLLLLFGYAYAHTIATRLTPRLQARLHTALLLLAIAILIALAFRWRAPILPGEAWKPQSAGWEVPRILELLAISVGVPFFLLSATGPLLQYWFSSLYPSSSPYPLYALSNFGSLVGLLSYPFLVEPFLRMSVQAWLWTSLFLVFAVACSICAGKLQDSAVVRSPASNNVAQEPPPKPRIQALWVLLAMLPSVLLLATTNIICQEVAVIALLWAVPLSVYLISFVLCFGSGRLYVPGAVHLGFGIAAYLLAIWVVSWSMVVYSQIAILVFVLFVCCMFCHGELYRRRPARAHLTTFYLSISLGGALGGVFVTLIAPYIFPGFWEFWLATFTCIALMLTFLIRDPCSWLPRTSPWIPVAVAIFALTFALRLQSGVFLPWHFVLFALAIPLLVLGIRNIQSSAGGPSPPSVLRLTRIALLASASALVIVCVTSIAATYKEQVWAGRNFYGVLSIRRNQGRFAAQIGYSLFHGRTLHGFQMEGQGSERLPTSYYSPISGVGLTFRNHFRVVSPGGQGLNVGVIGLGIGTIAAYGRAGDHIRFYEINDRVIRVARGEYGHFSYLSGCPATVTVVPGDARLSLERELQSGQNQKFDILVVDAFSGDAIPVHLLTAEAMHLYLQHLRDEHSVIAFHVSNNSLDLVPVVATLAENSRLKMEIVSSGRKDLLFFNSTWTLLSRDPGFFARPQMVSAAQVVPRRRVRLWTDDYSSLAQILRY